MKFENTLGDENSMKTIERNRNDENPWTKVRRRKLWRMPLIFWAEKAELLDRGVSQSGPSPMANYHRIFRYGNGSRHKN